MAGLGGLAAQGPPAGPAVSPPALVDEGVWRRFDDGVERTAVWVFFADKGPIDRAAAIRTLESTAHPRALQRRRLRRTTPGLFDERDVPIWPGHRRAVEATGAHLRTGSRWLNAVSVEATAMQVEALHRLPFVTEIRLAREIARLPMARTPVNSQDAGGASVPTNGRGGFYGAAEPQLALLNLIALHQDGFTGQGVVIGVLDTGFRRTHAAYNNAGDPLEVIAEHDFVNDDPNTAPESGDLPGQHDHGTVVLGTMAANQPGVLVGGAYGASYILAKAEDLAGEYAAEEDYFVAGLEFIEANGGDIATSSLVINGLYTADELNGVTTVMSRGLNVATDNGVHCFQGVGNSGHDGDASTASLVPPADAIMTISVGAVTLSGKPASFSSDGPTADGRLKPEILSMGVDVATTSGFDDVAVSAESGTSLATPLAAAAAACIVQMHPEWTVRQLRSALFQTANWYTATQSFDPLYVWGYGVIDAHAAANATPKLADLDEDFVVGVSDLLILLADWGPCLPVGECAADVSGDGAVGVTDLLALLADWGD